MEITSKEILEAPDTLQCTNAFNIKLESVWHPDLFDIVLEFFQSLADAQPKSTAQVIVDALGWPVLRHVCLGTKEGGGLFRSVDKNAEPPLKRLVTLVCGQGPAAEHALFILELIENLLQDDHDLVREDSLSSLFLFIEAIEGQFY